jgi:hypothetical protein
MALRDEIDKIQEVLKVNEKSMYPPIERYSIQS